MPSEAALTPADETLGEVLDLIFERDVVKDRVLWSCQRDWGHEKAMYAPNPRKYDATELDQKMAVTRSWRCRVVHDNGIDPDFDMRFCVVELLEPNLSKRLRKRLTPAQKQLLGIPVD